VAIRAKGLDEPLFICDRQLVGEEIILGTARAKDRLVQSTCRHCTLKIANSHAVTIGNCYLNECIFDPQKTVNATWLDNYWEKCVFLGDYNSTHFGQKAVDTETYPWGAIAVRGCDFTQATMHVCAFNRTDINSIKFPRWPCFTIIQPSKHRLVWEKMLLPLPEWLMRSWYCETSPVDAEVLHWPTIAKKWCPDHDPDEVKAVLETLDFVHL
jgi:hypothetical protein